MYIKVTEYAKKIGKNPSTVYHAIQSGKIESVTINNKILVDSNTKWFTKREEYIRKNHGLSKHPLHNIWRLMKNRCNNPKNKSYKYYGGKGIKVCDKWENDFYTFYQWAISHGWEEGLTIDRIDHNGNYEPRNCRFITRVENAIHAVEDANKAKVDEKRSRIRNKYKKIYDDKWYYIKALRFKRNSHRKSERYYLSRYYKYFENGFTEDLFEKYPTLLSNLGLSSEQEYRVMHRPRKDYINEYIQDVYAI